VHKHNPARATHPLPSSFMISVTPFAEDGSLDEHALRAHLRRQRENGIGVYLIGSGSGEGYSLTRDERARVMTIGREELQGHVPVRAMGCEHHSAAAMVSYIREVEASGLDAVHIYSLDMGHGAKPTPDEMEAYYNEVVGASSIPVVLSTHRVAGYMLPVPFIEKLVDRFEHIVGIVSATEDVAYQISLVQRLGARIEVHCGGPAHGPTILSLGGAGFLANESNLRPELAAGIVAAWKAGDIGGVRQNYTQLMGLYEINQRYGGSSMRAMKPLMRHFGFEGGVLRPPRQPIGAEQVAKAAAEIGALGIF